MVCAGTDLQLGATASGGSGIYPSYTWSGQTAPLSETGILNPVFNTYLRGTYNLKFTVMDSHGCQASDSVSILNDSPLSRFTSDAKPGCSPASVNFTNLSDNAVDYSWDFGDGFTSTLENPAHIFYNQSTSVQYFNVRLTATSLSNCSHTTNDYITVYPNPELNISTYPEKACAPADILLSSTPGGFSYNWDFGDGNSASGDFNMMHTFDNHTDRDTTFDVTPDINLLFRMR